MSPSEHINELKIDSTFWADPKRIINLLDFDPKKLSIYTELNSISNKPDANSKDLIEVYNDHDNGGECSLCKFYYFLDKNFKYGPYLCDGCYDIFIKTLSTQNLTIISHNGNYYRVIFAFISKKDAYNLIKNAVILGEKGTL